MRTKNGGGMTEAEHEHVMRVKSLPCSVCDTPPISHAHHPRQGMHFLVVALCPDCHQGPFNGWHGQRRIWAVKKMDEWDALAVTLRRLEEREWH